MNMTETNTNFLKNQSNFEEWFYQNLSSNGLPHVNKLNSSAQSDPMLLNNTFDGMNAALDNDLGVNWNSSATLANDLNNNTNIDNNVRLRSDSDVSATLTMDDRNLVLSSGLSLVDTGRELSTLSDQSVVEYNGGRQHQLGERKLSNVGFNDVLFKIDETDEPYGGDGDDAVDNGSSSLSKSNGKKTKLKTKVTKSKKNANNENNDEPQNFVLSKNVYNTPPSNSENNNGFDPSLHIMQRKCSEDSTTDIEDITKLKLKQMDEELDLINLQNSVKDNDNDNDNGAGLLKDEPLSLSPSALPLHPPSSSLSSSSLTSLTNNSITTTPKSAKRKRGAKKVMTPKQKEIHNKVEKKYRININTKIAKLQNVIPWLASANGETAFEIHESAKMTNTANNSGLPVSCDSTASFNTTMPFSLTPTNSNDGATDSIDTIQKNNVFNNGNANGSAFASASASENPKTQMRLNKSIILEKAVDYIQYLQNNERLYELEIQRLQSKLECLKNSTDEKVSYDTQ